MPKIKVRKTREEKLIQARLHKRRMYEEMKKDPAKYEIQKEKDRQRYLKRKEQKKIKGIADLTPREQRMQRKKWEVNSRAYLEKKKKDKRIQEIIIDTSISTSVREENVAANQDPLEGPSCQTQDKPKSGCTVPQIRMNTDLNVSTQTLSVDKLEYTSTLEVQPLTNDREPSAKEQVRLLTNKLMAGQDDGTNSEKSGTPNRLDNTSNVISTRSLCEDEFHFFGMNVASQLRRLPLHIALRLQSEFQNALYLARVQGQSSCPGPDLEETTNQTIEGTEIESIEQDLDEKDFPIDIQDTIDQSLASPLKHEE